MKDKDIKVACPYCGTSNSIDDKACLKCGNRIPKSAIEKAMNAKDEPPILINNKKDDSNTKISKKAISPLRRRGGALAKREVELKTEEIKEEPVKISSVLEITEQARENKNDVEQIEKVGREVSLVEEPEEVKEEPVVLEERVREEEGSHETEVQEEPQEKVELTVVEEEKIEEKDLKSKESEIEKDSIDDDEDTSNEAQGAIVEAEPEVEASVDSEPEKKESLEEAAQEVPDAESEVNEDAETAEEPKSEEETPLEEVQEEEQKSVSENEKRLYDTNVEYIVEEWNRNYKPVEKALEDEIVLPDDDDEGEEIIDIRPQNDIVKIKNDISEYLKAQEEIDLDTTVCLNVPDVMNALYKSEVNEDDEYFNTHVYPNLEGELYEAAKSAEEETVESDIPENLYEEDETDLETKEYQLDMQVLEDNVPKNTDRIENKENKENIADKIKKAHKENKEKKAADETRLNLPVYILGVLLKPLSIHEKEKDKLKKFKNTGKFALLLIFAMTILGLLREMVYTVRVISYWTGEISWAWDKLGDVQYFKVLGDQLLIYTGIIGGLSLIHYVVSAFMKKKTDIVELISAVCTAFVPFGISYGLLSLILSVVYMPLAIIVTIVGFIYSILILLELVDELIVIEDKNKRLMFHLISLSIMFVIAGLMLYSYLSTLA